MFFCSLPCRLAHVKSAYRLGLQTWVLSALYPTSIFWQKCRSGCAKACYSKWKIQTVFWGPPHTPSLVMRGTLPPTPHSLQCLRHLDLDIFGVEPSAPLAPRSLSDPHNFGHLLAPMDIQRQTSTGKMQTKIL